MNNRQLLIKLNEIFEPEQFVDAAYNGLQVEGINEINRVVVGVSANEALINSAIESRAEAIFVHHGLFWSPGLKKLDGFMRKRVKLLLSNNINLYAYHLPLDAHPSLGNNAQLFNALALASSTPFGFYKGQAIGLMGQLSKTLSPEKFVGLIRQKVGVPNFVLGEPSKSISRVAICSGAAPELFYEAIDQGADAYLCGEATEWVTAMANESKTMFVAAGHHQTETFGPKAICELLKNDFGLDSMFVDIKNPV